MYFFFNVMVIHVFHGYSGGIISELSTMVSKITLQRQIANYFEVQYFLFSYVDIIFLN